MNFQKRVWEIVEFASDGDSVSRIFDISILGLIFLNVIAVILGSVKGTYNRFGSYFDWFEIFSVVVFTIEYTARIWSCISASKFQRPIIGRIHFALQPMLLIDLIAILPFYLPFLGIDLRSIRVLRLLRIFRVAKIGRYYSSFELIKNVLKSKKEELILTSAIMAFMLIISSSVLFYCENSVQPEAFSSVPATMWWSVATLTTVGYGDMLPVTPIGKLLASIIAILGIGMFALPTGILGAGFIEEIQKKKKEPKKCPHCGKEL
ncbi:MAG: ion transporter [Candidatus Latescibacteria bacterium]|nr:ion transporter [Candidatus Latescibacterota bacterium]